MASTSSLERMRIMLVNGSLFGGGAEHVIATLARHLRRAGHHVVVAVIHHGGEVKDELVAEGFEVITRIAEGGSALTTSARLKHLIRDRDVDVVHSHDLRSLVDASLCRLQSRRFAHVHTFHFGNYPHLPRKELLLESAFCRIPDRLIAVGNAQRGTLVRAHRLSPARIHTLWNGVDYAAEVSEHAIGSEGLDGPLIGSVSTFGLQKGLPTLLDAAHRLHSRGMRFRLLLVGDGELRAQLEAKARALGIADRVAFTGWQPDAATRLLPTFDIFVQSSHWEAMSVVILEAMAARRPIVATTVGENPFVLKDGVSAILVPPRDAEALAAGLARAIEDKTLRQRLAEAAHDDYRARFTGDAMAQRYVALYHECRVERTGHRLGMSKPANMADKRP